MKTSGTEYNISVYLYVCVCLNDTFNISYMQILFNLIDITFYTSVAGLAALEATNNRK